MARLKRNFDKFQWVDFHAETDPGTGKRIYHTPDGPAPSVTTILSSIPTPELDEWRDKVGPVEADRITKEATDIGSLMHDQLEARVRRVEFVPNPAFNPDQYLEMSQKMAQSIEKMQWRNIREVWAVEQAVHYKGQYAGRADMIGVHGGEPAIMDYKSAKYIKRDLQSLDKYKMQLAAYAIAVEWLVGQKITRGVNFFAIRPNEFSKNRAESYSVVITGTDMDLYKRKWLSLLENYQRGA